MNFIFFHHPCSDGMASATIAYESLKKQQKDVIIVPSPPGKFPQTLPLDYQEPKEGDTIYILDTCYSPEILKKLSEKTGKKVIVLDHHEYSKDWVGTFCDGVHDSARSGCRLAWDYFYPNTDAPKTVLFIEDRDLWKWEIPQSKEFNDYFYTMVPIERESYHPFIFGDHKEQLVSDSTSKGSLLGQFIQMQINEITKTTNVRLWQGEKTAFVNSSLHVSELSSFLLSKNDETGSYGSFWFCDVAFVWTKNEKTGKIKVSLRSRKDDLTDEISADVNKLAEKFGGGGHKTASGFICDSLDDLD